jgi:hypothetical protein
VDDCIFTGVCGPCHSQTLVSGWAQHRQSSPPSCCCCCCCVHTGRLRVMARGQAAEIRLEDGSSGELFAVCPFTPATQSVAVEATADSSR